MEQQLPSGLSEGPMAQFIQELDVALP